MPAAGPSATSRAKADVLALVRRIPASRVTTFDAIADACAMSARHVFHLLANLSEDEREFCPWHRVVAKGGAIGHGPHREAQFARLVREGVSVSPAGIVQDLARHVVHAFARESDAAPIPVAPAPKPVGSRSRGMKERP